MQFQTDGSPAMTIDSSQRVGIGTTSPLTDAQLTISADDTPGLAFQRSGSGKFETAIQISSGHFHFKAGADSSTIAGLSDVMNIESTGDVHITDGNLKIATSGHGIDFSATSAASGKSSELLDDYEEGTWTPTFKYWTGSAWADVAFSNTPVTTNAGLYTKIGNVVHFSYYTENFVVTTGAGSTASIQNLPFTHASGSFTAITCSHWNGMGDNENAFIFGNTKEIRFTQEDSIDQASWGSGLSHIMISGTYRVA